MFCDPPVNRELVLSSSRNSADHSKNETLVLKSYCAKKDDTYFVDFQDRPMFSHVIDKVSARGFYQPTTIPRCRSEIEKNILEDLFSSVLPHLKKILPLWKPEI